MNNTLHIQRIDDTHYAKTVGMITVPGSPAGGKDDNLLHWRLFIVLDSYLSVKLDIRPGGADLRTGILIGSSVNYINSQSAAAWFNVWPAQPFTVSELLDFLVERRYHRFRFNSEGTGCLHWCTEVIRLLELSGFVQQGSTARLEAHIVNHNQLHPTHVPFPIGSGSFY